MAETSAHRTLQSIPPSVALCNRTLSTSLKGRTALSGVAALVLMGLYAAPPAVAEPAGGVVVGGSATIRANGAHTQIDQSTRTAIINWQKFGVKSGESVTFAQPDAGSLAVNRVQTQVPSHIAGQLTANGNVWIVNPSGVYIQQNAQVNVGGLLATTADIDDQRIMAGDYTFSGAPDGSAVTNAGTIAAEGGSVVLVAPVVENSGTIKTNGSDVAIGAGDRFTVDFTGDGLTRFEVGGTGGNQLVNTGTISAQGGAAYLTAATSEAVRDSVVSIGGAVEATRIEDRGGVIVISGAETTEVSGTLTAGGTDGQGGEVSITGAEVALSSTARIDVSGSSGGGTVLVGGDYQGTAISAPVISTAPETAPLPNARRVVVASGSTISADALDAGDGGRVILWADQSMAFAGNISATGGVAGGDGGFAEVSGKDTLGFLGGVDLSAPFGETGTLLLDPTNIQIVSAGADSNAQLDDFIIGFAEGSTTSIITDARIETALLTASVTLQATSDITVDQAINSNTTFDLTLQAGNDILLNADISTGGALTLSANDNGATTASGSGGIVFGGTISLTAGANAGATNRALVLDLNGSSGALTDTTNGQTVTLTSNAAFDLPKVDFDNTNSSLVVSAEDVSIADTVTVDSVSFQQTTPGTMTLGIEDASAATFDLTATELNLISADTATFDSQNQSVVLRGAEADAITDLVIDAGTGGVSLVLAASLFDNNIEINTSGVGTISQTVRIGVGGTADFSTAQALTFGNSANDFGGEVSVSAAGQAVSLADNNLIGLGTITAASLDVSARDITISDVTATGAVTLENAQADDITIGTADANQNTFDLVGSDLRSIDAATVDVTTTSGDFTLSAITLAAAEDYNLTLATGAGDINVTAGFVGTGGTLLLDADGSGTDGEISLTGAGNLSNTNDITLTADGEISLDGSVTTTTAGDITLTADADTTDSEGIVFEGTLSVSAAEALSLSFGAAALTDGNNGTATLAAGTAGGGEGIVLPAVDFSSNNLSLAADGTISSTAQIGVSAGDFSAETTGDAISLTNTSNDFASFAADTDSANAGAKAAVTVADANAIQLGAIDASSLTVDTSGSITDTGGQVIAATSGIDLETGGTGDIVLDETTHQIAGTVVLSGEDIEFRSDASVTFGAVTATGGDSDATLNSGSTEGDATLVSGSGSISLTGALTLANSGDLSLSGDGITQNAAAVITTDVLSIDAGSGSAVLTQANDAGQLDISGGSVNFNDTNALVLGTISADALTVTTGGTISDTAGAITVSGATTLTAGAAGNFFDIQLDSADVHDFAEAADFTATGEDITVDDLDGIQLAAITATGGDVEDTTIAGNAGDFSLSVDGAITATTAVAIDGATNIALGVAGEDVIFDNSANDFGGTVTISGQAPGNVTLIDANALSVGTISVDDQVDDDGDLTTRTDFDLVTLGANSTIAVSGTITAPLISVQDTSGDGIDFGAAASNPVNVPANAASFVGALELVTAGDIAVNFGGAGTFGNDVFLDAGGPVSFDTSSFAAAFGGDLTIDAGGAVSQSGAVSGLSVSGVTDINASGQTVTLGTSLNDFGGAVDIEAGTATIADLNTLTLRDIDLTGGLSATGATSIVDSGASVAGDGIDVGTTTALTGTTITLDDAVNEFTGAVSASGTTVTLSDDSNIVLGTVSATTLTVDADGEITQDATGVSVSGTASLTSDDGVVRSDITLAEAANSLGTVDALGNEITLRDDNGIVLGAVDAEDGLTVNAAAGDITDDGSAITVGGTTGLAAGGDIAIDTAATHTFTGAVTLAGEDIVFRGQAPSAAQSLSIAGASASGTGASATVAGSGDITITSDLGELSLEGAVSGPGAITLAGDDGITQSAGTVTAPTLALDPGAGESAVLTQANDVDRVDLASGSLDLNDADDVALGAVTAGSLDISAGGDITDVAGEAVTVSGQTTLTAQSGVIFFDVLLDNSATHDFAEGSDFVATGNDITVDDVDGIRLGALSLNTGGNLSITAGGTPEQTVAINVPGTTTITAPGFEVDFSLANDFGGTVSVAGTDVTLADINDIELGDIDATLNLDVAAGGDITDDGDGLAAGDDIDVGGVASFDAGGDIILNDAFNDFDTDASGDVVQAVGDSIVIQDAGSIQLGQITATNGDLVVTSTVGDITDTPGVAITATGTADLSAANGGVILDNDQLHDFGTVNATALNQVVLNDVNGIDLADISVGGTLDVTARGAITDSGTLAVGGDASFLTESAGAASLTIDGTSGTFGGTVTLDTDIDDDGGHANVTFVDNDTDLTLGDVDAQDVAITSNGTGGMDASGGIQDIEGSATFTALGGAVVLSNAANDFTGVVSVDADSDASGDAGTVQITDQNALALGAVDAGALDIDAGGAVTDTVGQAISVTGASDVNAGVDNISLANGLHDFDSDITGDALSLTGGNVEIADIDQLSLGASTVSGTLDLTALDFDIDGVVSVAGGAGTATLTSPQMSFSETAGIAATDGSGNGFTIAFGTTDAGNLDTSSVLFADTGTLASPFKILDFDSGTAIGDIEIQSSGDIDFGDSATAGTRSSIFRAALTLDAGDDVRSVPAATSVIETTVQGALTISADAVTLNDQDNDFQGLVTVSATSATLADANDVLLGDFDIASTLSVTGVAGAITDQGSSSTPGDAIDVGGTSSFSAGGVVALDDTGNDFAGAVSASGTDITLVDDNTITLGAVSAAQDLSVDADGTITQTSDGVSVAGVTTFRAVDDQDDGVAANDVRAAIALQTAANDFGGGVDADGTNIALADANDIVLGDIDASGALTVVAGAAISDDGNGGVGGDINVAGATQLTAQGDITLDDAAHDFDTDNSGDTLSAAGASITIADVDSLVFGDIDASGALEASAGGDLTDSGAGVAGAGVDVAGATRLVSGGDITLDDAVNDFDSDAVGTPSDAVSASAANVSLRDANSVALGDLDVNGALSVEAGGVIVDSGAVTAGQGIDVAGDATFVAGGAIALDDTVNDFDSDSTGGPVDRVDASGTSISLADIDAIRLGDIDATGTLSVVAAGTIIDDGASVLGAGINVAGATTLSSGAAIRLDDAVNDFDSNGGSLPSDAVSAAGTTIVLRDTSGIALGDVDASGTLTVTANGSIVDAGANVSGAGVNAGGVSTLTAADDIVLDDAVHDFTDRVDASADNITLADETALQLGDIDATGALTVNTGGAITDSGAAIVGDGIDVGATARIAATSGSIDGDVTLDDGVNRFGSALSVAGADITVQDRDGLTLGDVDASGNFAVTANGAISDSDASTSGTGIDVGGTTTLIANGNIVLDDAVNNFDSNAGGANDATDALSADGDFISIRDEDALSVGTITATGDLILRSGGSITDTTASRIAVSGSTSIQAESATGGNFFDVALQSGQHDYQSLTVEGEDVAISDINDLVLSATANADGAADATIAGTGSLDILVAGSISDTANAGQVALSPGQGGGALSAAGDIDLQSNGALLLNTVTAGGDIDLSATNELTLGSASAGGSVTASAGGFLTFATINAGTGIDLTTQQSFEITTVAGTPLSTGGQLTLRAPNGSFTSSRGANTLQDGLTFTANSILIDVGRGFTIEDTTLDPFTLNAGVANFEIDTGTFSIGSAIFIANSGDLTFDPFTFPSDIFDSRDLLRVTGSAGFFATGPGARVVVQNTSLITDQGAGTTIDGLTTIGGAFDSFTLFGNFNSASGQNAAIQGFQSGAGFVGSAALTANGCVLLIASSCQPIGSLVLTFEFNDDQLLGIKFVDPTEDEDDPFSNRGDEEEWD